MPKDMMRLRHNVLSNGIPQVNEMANLGIWESQQMSVNTPDLLCHFPMSAHGQFIKWFCAVKVVEPRGSSELFLDRNCAGRHHNPQLKLSCDSKFCGS